MKSVTKVRKFSSKIVKYRKTSNKRPAFIRIITFHGEGDGHLLEARVLTNNT